MVGILKIFIKQPRRKPKDTPENSHSGVLRSYYGRSRLSQPSVRNRLLNSSRDSINQVMSSPEIADIMMSVNLTFMDNRAVIGSTMIKIKRVNSGQKNSATLLRGVHDCC